MAQILIGTATDGFTTYEVWAEENGSGGTDFTIKLTDGTGNEDILGFFLDYADSNNSLVLPDADISASFFGNGGDGQVVPDDIEQVGVGANTMNGTHLVFDAGMQFGKAGANDMNDVAGVSFTVANLTFADLDGMTFGIRAQNTGPNGGDSVKLIGHFDTSFDISGTKYLDANGDGQTDGDDGLGNVTIFVDLNDDGENNDGISTTTAADGSWSFTDLGANVVGHKVLEVLPSGYVQTLGNDGYTINGDATGLDFANFNLVDLSGTKYLDANGDGQTDGDDGLGNVTIFVDLNDDGENNDGISATTAADGSWSFTGLGANVLGHKVLEVLPSGYVQTLGNDGYTINGDATGLDFANFNLVDLSGTKYLDANGDGQTDGDDGLGNVTIFVDLNDDGENNDGISATTAADGSWSFTGLGANVLGHKVLEVLPSGYVQTLGNDGYTINGDATGLDFANAPELFDISGTKYLDANGDGLTVGDSGLGGVRIFIDLNNNGVFNWTDGGILNGVWDAGEGDNWTTTATNGTWSFTDLDASYVGKTVYEVVPAGYVQTLGNDGYLIDGDATGLDFANTPLARSPGYWITHDGSGPQANDWDIAPGTSFETYFGVTGPYNGSWDKVAPVNGKAGVVADITFKEALGLPNGGDGQNGLAREATTAVLNFLDEDTHNAFVAAYEALRDIDFSDANNDLAVLNDLKAEVQGALDTDPATGHYTIAQLTGLLIQTHD
jgi:hypothetical protein